MVDPETVDRPGITRHLVVMFPAIRARHASESDLVRCREAIGRAVLRGRCTLHAWVIVPGEVQLLVTARAPGGVSRMRHVLACTRELADPAITCASRTVTGDREILEGYVAIESAPVGAGRAAMAASYRWSSHGVNALGQHDAGLSPHAAWQRLGEDDGERREAYRHLFATPVAASATSTPPHAACTHGIPVFEGLASWETHHPMHRRA